MAQVVLRDLTKIFKGPRREDIRALTNLNLTVADGEFMVLVGPSGSGKSTTLRLIAGLEEITSGEISLDGRVINRDAPGDRDIAMVFQNHALYPHLTVFENLAFGLKLRRFPRAEIEQRVGAAADLLGLRDCLGRRPDALSGGQRQRVAVGRALVRQPKVFLFDEPLSNLDARLRVQLRREISRLHARLRATMLYVTHDQVEAMTLGDRIAVMRDGVIQQVAEPLALYGQPANMFVAGFIGSPPMNFFHGTLAQKGGDIFFQETAASGTGGFALRVPGEMAARLANHTGKKIVLGLRPEHITECGQTAVDAVETTVDAVEPLGPETHLYATTGTHVFVARLPAVCQLKSGDKISLAFDLRHAHFFDPATEKALPG